MTETPRCPAHPTAEAVAACVQCGRWVCADCRRVGEDGLGRCAECVDDATAAEPELPEAPTGPPDLDPPEAPNTASADEEDADDAAAAPPPPDPLPATRPPPTWVPPRPAEPEMKIVGPTPVPWEQSGRHSDLQAFVLTAREALLGPARYMGRIPWVRGDLRTPLVFALLAGIIGQLGLMLITRFVGPPAGMTGAAGGFSQLPVGSALATAPLLPMMVAVSIFAGAWLAHAMLRLSGDPPRPFEATFRVYAYAEVSSLLLLVPWIGPYAARFAFVFLLLTGFRMAQGAGFSASLLAMAPSVVLMWVLV